MCVCACLRVCVCLTGKCLNSEESDLFKNYSDLYFLPSAVLFTPLATRRSCDGVGVGWLLALCLHESR